MFSIHNLEYTDLLIFSVLLSTIMVVFLSSQQSRVSHSTRLLLRFIISLMIVGVFEIISWLVAIPGRSGLIPIQYLSNALFFSVNLLPASLGLCYLDYIITLSKERNAKRTYLYLLPVYVNIALTIFNLFFDGFLFRIDANNVYHRGIATYLGNAFTILFAIGVIISFSRYRQMITGRITQVILVLTLVPIAGTAYCKWCSSDYPSVFRAMRLRRLSHFY